VNAKTLYVVLFLFFLLLPSLASAGFIDVRDQDGEINSAVGLKGWFSQADAKWRISFPYVTSGGQAGKIESELRFNDIDSPLAVVTGGGKIGSRFSFDILYGAGDIARGRGTDTDRFIPSSGSGLEFSQSQNDISGDVMMWGGNLYYNNKLLPGAGSGPWGLVVGFLHYEDNLTLRNGAQTNTVPFEGLNMPLGPFSGLNSTFNFEWNMLKVGVLRRARLSKGFSYSGLFAAYPYVDYRGEGYWNLRAGTNPNDFRMQSPNFIQQASTSYGSISRPKWPTACTDTRRRWS